MLTHPLPGQLELLPEDRKQRLSGGAQELESAGRPESIIDERGRELSGQDLEAVLGLASLDQRRRRLDANRSRDVFQHPLQRVTNGG